MAGKQQESSSGGCVLRPYERTSERYPDTLVTVFDRGPKQAGHSEAKRRTECKDENGGGGATPDLR